MRIRAASRSILLLLPLVAGCLEEEPDLEMGEARSEDTVDDRIRAAQARTDPNVIDTVQIRDSITGRPLEGDALRDARSEVRRLYDQFCRDDFFPDPTFNMPSRDSFAHDTVIHSPGPDTATPVIGAVGDLDNNAFDDLIGVYEGDDDIRVTPGRLNNPGREVYKHELPPPPGPGQPPQPGSWTGPGAPSGTWSKDTGSFRILNGARNLNKGDFANRGSALTALSLWGPEIRGPGWPAGKTMLLGLNQNQDVVAYEIRLTANRANWEAVNRKVWTADHANRNSSNRAYKRALPVFTRTGTAELVTIIDIVDSTTRTPTRGEPLFFAAGKAVLSWNSDTVRFETWSIKGLVFLYRVSDIAIEYDFSPPAADTAPRNHLGAVQYLVTFQYNTGFVQVARGKITGGNEPETTDVFHDTRFPAAYLPARDLNLAIAHGFDYQDELDRTRRISRNTYLITIGDRSWYMRSPPLASALTQAQRVERDRKLPVGGTDTGLTPGAWEYTAKQGTFTFAGDFGGRRVHIEPVRVGDRDYVFPTQATWRPQVLVIPPPHWVGLQDWGSANYGERRGTDRGETTIYENQSQRGSGWTVGGSVGTAPFGISGGYSRDRDDTEFESTNVQTDHTRSIDVGFTADENYRPMLIADYLCSDDHWFLVRRGTVRARQGNDVTRTELADSRQYMVVSVPRRSRDFFDDPSRCTPQDRARCGITPIHRAVLDLNQFRTHAYRVGQSWMDLSFDRPLTVPWTYPQHGAERKFFDIAGNDLPEGQVFHYTAALQAAQFGNVSVDINRTTQTTTNRQELRGTSWTVSQRVEGTLSFPIPYVPFSQVQVNGGYNWHHGGSSTEGRGVTLGRHETTSIQARISGFRRFALRESYTDDNEYSVSNPIETFHQRWAFRHILGFDWGHVFRVRNGGATANVQYWSEGSLARGETADDDRAIEPKRLSWEEATVEELMKPVHYKVWPFMYRYRHERAWQRKVGGQDQPFAAHLDFQVVDFLVDFFNSKDIFPAGFHRDRVPFPRRKNVLFNGPRDGGVADSFCDYMGNRVLEVAKVYDRAGLPPGTAGWTGRQAIFRLKPGGDCWAESRRGAPKVCRETHAATGTTAACVPKDANEGDTPNELNRPPRDDADRSSCNTSPETPSGLVEEGPPLCDGEIVRQWVEVSSQDRRGVYVPVQSCLDQCVQGPSDATCDDTFDPPEIPGQQDPGGPAPAPACQRQRDSACATDGWCCAPPGQPWFTPLQWGTLCASMTDGVCAEAPPRCGDNAIDRAAGETCDDGNRRGGDGCSATCRQESSARCGDGILQGELCDDGNNLPGDGCSPDCRDETTCGDGIPEGSEACDDGNSDDSDGCRRDCTPTPSPTAPPPGTPKPPFCGDGIPDLGEQCDDALGRCHNCVLDGVCGDGVVQPSEACDDANIDPTDGCSSCTHQPLLTVAVQGSGQGALTVEAGGAPVCTGPCIVRIQDLVPLTISATSGTSRPHVQAIGPYEVTCQDTTDATAFRLQCTVPATSLDRALLVSWSQVQEPDRPRPTCGDGQVDAALEECDDGNTFENDGCSSWCEIEACSATCGNGLVDLGEECDDGNAVNEDGCSYLCLDESIPPHCGDGLVDPDTGEECDDGNLDEHDGCAACQYERCGDGWLQPGEQCDDGNAEDDDGCSTYCLDEYCGDAVLQPGEQCDDGNDEEGDGCTPACTEEFCGDSVVQEGEECDDGNDEWFDGCTPSCTLPACGNGELEDWEECDDGNDEDDDGCSSACELEYCGDGIVQLDEYCDDGNDEDGDGCTATCELETTAPTCGDGVIEGDEECDDGNTTAGDGCSPTCRIERCGDGVIDEGEECDPGTGEPGCSQNCRCCDEGGTCEPRPGGGCQESCGMSCHTAAPPTWASGSWSWHRAPAARRLTPALIDGAIGRAPGSGSD